MAYLPAPSTFTTLCADALPSELWAAVQGLLGKNGELAAQNGELTAENEKLKARVAELEAKVRIDMPSGGRRSGANGTGHPRAPG